MQLWLNLLPVVSCSSERDTRGLSEPFGVFPGQRLRALPRATLPVLAEGGDISPWNLSPRLPCRTLRTERKGCQPLHECVLVFLQKRVLSPAEISDCDQIFAVSLTHISMYDLTVLRSEIMNNNRQYSYTESAVPDHFFFLFLFKMHLA